MISRRGFLIGTAATAATASLGHLVTLAPTYHDAPVIEWISQHFDFGRTFGVGVQFSMPNGMLWRQAVRFPGAHKRMQHVMIEEGKQILREWALRQHGVVLVG